MNKFKKTAIIIVTYKALEYVKKCIQSILVNTTIPFELIVVDNNSGKEVVEYISNLEGIIFIKNDKNVLLTPAQNQGLKEISSDVNYILFLNPDVEIIRSDWLQLLIKKIEEKSEIGITGPIRNYSPISPTYGNIDMSCFLVKRYLLEEIGGLDNNYPWNGAGFVFTAVAWSNGWRYNHLKKPKILVHYKAKSRSHHHIENVKIDERRVLKRYNLQSKWTITGFLQQIYHKPELVWRAIRKIF